MGNILIHTDLYLFFNNLLVRHGGANQYTISYVGAIPFCKMSKWYQTDILSFAWNYLINDLSVSRIL